MRLSITDEGGNFKSLEVDSDMEIINLKALIEDELQIPSAQQGLFLNGNIISAASLKSAGINQDDILLVKRTRVAQSESERARASINSNPELRQRFVAQYGRPMELALESADSFSRVFQEMQRQEAQRQTEISSDPFDVASQQRIEEQIRNQNIMQNRENAIEYHPESFGRVIMLYINVEVNGHKVKAFVDSGAQATIMSPSCASFCNVLHILDTAFAGVAVGVGTAKILGRIHSTQVKIGQQFLPCSLTVMEGKDVDLLLGLDVLKRHQACIDLEKMCLRIGGENIPFLLEHEMDEKSKGPLPDRSEEKKEEEKRIMDKEVTVASKKKAESFPESSIKALLDLGVSRDAAIQCLEACNGNVDLASSMLFDV